MARKANTLIVTLILGILLALGAAEAQQAGKVWRLGFLSSLTDVSAQYLTDGLTQGLRELGYVEGQNIVIEYRWAAGDYHRLPHLATELVGLKPDLIFCQGPPATLAVKAATQTIPVVFVAGNPVGAGIVSGLAKPGANLTGFDVFAEELDAKRLELLTEVLPRAARVVLLLNPENPPAGWQRNTVATAATALGVQPRFVEARRPGDIDTAFATMESDRPDGVVVLGDPMFNTERRRIVALAARIRVPVIHYERDFTETGGLMSYGVDIAALNQRAAIYIDKILKGATPGDLPIQQPMKFELVINLKTAKTLGLTIPPTLLLQADKVIQ